jgi:hypothetical protein
VGRSDYDEEGSPHWGPAFERDLREFLEFDTVQQVADLFRDPEAMSFVAGFYWGMDLINAGAPQYCGPDGHYLSLRQQQFIDVVSGYAAAHPGGVDGITAFPAMAIEAMKSAFPCSRGGIR